jgi:hypothetical protein
MGSPVDPSCERLLRIAGVLSQSCILQNLVDDCADFWILKKDGLSNLELSSFARPDYHDIFDRSDVDGDALTFLGRHAAKARLAMTRGWKTRLAMKAVAKTGMCEWVGKSQPTYAES